MIVGRLALVVAVACCAARVAAAESYWTGTYQTSDERSCTDTVQVTVNGGNVHVGDWMYFTMQATDVCPGCSQPERRYYGYAQQQPGKWCEIYVAVGSASRAGVDHFTWARSSSFDPRIHYSKPAAPPGGADGANCDAWARRLNRYAPTCSGAVVETPPRRSLATYGPAFWEDHFRSLGAVLSCSEVFHITAAGEDYNATKTHADPGRTHGHGVRRGQVAFYFRQQPISPTQGEKFDGFGMGDGDWMPVWVYAKGPNGFTVTQQDYNPHFEQYMLTRVLPAC